MNGMITADGIMTEVEDSTPAQVVMAELRALYGIHPYLPPPSQEMEDRLAAGIEKLAQCETPDAVADFLRGEGITGRRRIASDCPVSRWLARFTGVAVSVGTTHAGLYGGIANHELPNPVRRFITTFDGGGYPDLAEPGPTLTPPLTVPSRFAHQVQQYHAAGLGLYSSLAQTTTYAMFGPLV